MRRRTFLALAAAWLALWAGRDAAAAERSVTVFAAADLAFAFRELAPRFEGATGARLTLVFGSTGNLAQQIRHGGPADVFFAADESFVDRLVVEGALIRETRTLYAQGRVVLATARGAGPRLQALDELRGPRVRHIAIANPAHAPYGRAAEEVLRRRGLWEALRPKLVYGENVRHALQFLQTGAADAGIVARSVADAPEIEWAPVDPALHAPLDQVAAVVRRSPRPELGLALIRFVTGAEGRPVLRRYGFRVPGEL